MVASALGLAACGGATSTVSHTSRAPASGSSAVPSSAAATDPIAADITAGQYPQCSLVVGEPTSLIVPSVSAAGNLDLKCITSPSAAGDRTGAGVFKCFGSGVAYYWASTDPSALDQTVYAAKPGGVVVIVPNETAKNFISLPGGLASVGIAVGC